MKASVDFQDAVFMPWPAFAIGRVGEDGEWGIAFGWMFWLVTVCGDAL